MNLLRLSYPQTTNFSRTRSFIGFALIFAGLTGVVIGTLLTKVCLFPQRWISSALTVLDLVVISHREGLSLRASSTCLMAQKVTPVILPSSIRVGSLCGLCGAMDVSLTTSHIYRPALWKRHAKYNVPL